MKWISLLGTQRRGPQPSSHSVKSLSSGKHCTWPSPHVKTLANTLLPVSSFLIPWHRFSFPWGSWWARASSQTVAWGWWDDAVGTRPLGVGHWEPGLQGRFCWSVVSSADPGWTPGGCVLWTKTTETEATVMKGSVNYKDCFFGPKVQIVRKIGGESSPPINSTGLPWDL